MRKPIATVLLISLVLCTSVLLEVKALSFFFTATISPTNVYVNQPITYSVTITVTGNKTLGSAGITIPTGFSPPSSITILAPPSTWSYTLSNGAINLTGNNGDAVIQQGGSLIFTFFTIAPTSSGITNWPVAATSNIGWSGTTLDLEGAQPTVTVNPQPPLVPPTITASLNTINQGQISLLSQSVAPSGGTSPYTYQWIESFNGGSFSSITGANGPGYSFSTTTSTAIGTWSFKLNVTDSSAIPVTVTSNSANVVVNSALTAPAITATPNTVYQSQASTLTSSPVTTGTSPYNFQWFQRAPGGNYITVGINSASYTFPGSTTTGAWTFLLQVTDSVGASTNSTSVDVTVSSTPIFTITVNQGPHGTINPGTTSVNLGSSQSYTISPDVGYHVADVLVDGLSVGAVTSYLFTNVIADQTLAATFVQNEYMLIVSVVGSGSVAKSPSQASYHYGDTVQLTATPIDDWSFLGWSGDFSISVNPVSVIINGSTSVTATFIQSASYILTVSTVGSGSVVKTPEQTSYHSGDAVTLTAIPSAGWSFSGWSDGFSNSANPVIVTINGTTSVIATFTQDSYALTVSTVGGGSVALNNAGPYHLGDVVKLTANPIAGWSFSAWSGALAGSANPVDLSIVGDMSVTAFFTQNAYSLTISIVGDGFVLASPNQVSYHSGDTVHLTAIPASGWRFGGWTGNLTGSLNPCSITINGNNAITAIFVFNQYMITASAAAGGSITPAGTKIVDHGGGQTYNITASIGYYIIDVSVNGTSVGPVASYAVSNVTGDTTIAASFAMNPLTINSWAGSHGSINPNGTLAVAYGIDQTFTFSPDPGYHIANVVVDGTSVGAVVSYLFTNVTVNHNVSVSFEIDTYIITAIAGSHGTINPIGTVVVDWNATQTFAVTPDTNYYIVEVVVDGVLLGAVTSYTFAGVAVNHNITAEFAATTTTIYYFINVTSSHGTPTPSAQINAGDSFTASVTNYEGDSSHRWICTGYSIDGNAPISGTNYTFTNVQANHTIAFNLQEQYYLTVISQDSSTTGTGWYNKGTTATVSVSSNTVDSNSSTRKIFAGWTVDATGTDTTSEPITIDGPKTATANWKIQYRVAYDTSGNVLPVAAPPTEWVNSGASTTGTFPTSVTNSDGNTRSVFAYDNRPTTIAEPMTITGTYKTQYLVKFSQNRVALDASIEVATILGEPKMYLQFPHNIWIDRGGYVAFGYAATVESTDAGKKYILSSINCTSPLTINEPTTIQGNYEPETSSNLDTITLSAVLISIPLSFTIPILAWRRRKKEKIITPIAYPGGSISPSTAQTIERGGDSTVFIISAYSGYKIADVVIDNAVHLGAVRTHKFIDVNQSHTITAIFHKK